MSPSDPTSRIAAEAPGYRAEPERFRDYLRLLARIQVGKQLQSKVDASDIVQQTLLEAHRQQRLFRGQTDAELAAWLRQLLASSLARQAERLKRFKRDPSREMQQGLDQSSLLLANWLAADQSSPSQHLERHENALLLVEALGQLPEAQREALVLRHFQNWSINDISAHLGKTTVAVSSLLQRGVRQLRELLRPPA